MVHISRTGLVRRSRARIARRLIAVALLGSCVWCGCSDAQGDGEARTIKYSGGEYNRGYRDGMRDAQTSLMDDHAGFLWLWIMDKEYGQGYDRGWKDGRATVNLEKQKQSTQDRGDRDALSNDEDK